MRRPLVQVVVGVCALVLAAPVALLGRAVLATPAAVALEARAWPAGTQVVSSRSLAERAARVLLAADRAERLARIARAYERAAASPALVDTSVTALRLAQLARHVGSASERADAKVMAGAVFALPAGSGAIGFDTVRRLGGGASLAEAAQEFRAAVLGDTRNEAAKYDLELLLKAEARPAASRHRRGKAAARQERKRQPKRVGRRGSRHAPAKRHPGGVYSTGSGY